MTERRPQEGTALIPSNLHVPEDCRALGEIGAGWRQMDGAGRRRARRWSEALQRNSPRAGQHLAADVDADAAGPRTGWPRHAYRVPHRSAARRLRADQAWTIVAQAGERIRSVGPAKPRDD